MQKVRPSALAISISDQEDNEMEMEKSPPAEQIRTEPNELPFEIELEQNEIDQLRKDIDEEKKEALESGTAQKYPILPYSGNFGQGDSHSKPLQSSHKSVKDKKRNFTYSFGRAPDDDSNVNNSSHRYGLPVPLPYTISQNIEFDQQDKLKEQPKDLIELGFDDEGQENIEEEKDADIPNFGANVYPYPPPPQQPPNAQHKENLTRFSQLFSNYPPQQPRAYSPIIYSPSPPPINSVPLDKSMIPLDIPQASFKPYEFSDKISSPSKNKLTQASAIINLQIPEPSVANFTHQIHNRPQEKTQSSADSLSRSGSGEEERPLNYSIKTDKQLQILTINTTKGTITKEITYDLMSYMQQYCREEYRTPLPAISSQIFTMGSEIAEEYLKVYVGFLLEYIPSEFLMFLRLDIKSKEKKKEETWTLANIYNQTKDKLMAVFQNQVEKTPIEKLATLITTTISQRKKIIEARKRLQAITSVQVAQCPFQNLNHENQKKLLCFTEWLISWERGQHYLQMRLSQFTKQPKNRAIIQLYRKMLQQYNVKKSIQNERYRQKLIECNFGTHKDK